MGGIVTLTFSPCIDKSASVPALIPEKKLRCMHQKLEPGGGGINVARAIKKLGGTATAVYPAGGYTGEFFNTLLKNEGVPTKVISTQSSTRENIIILDGSTNQQYRFGMPAEAISSQEWQACLDAIEEMEDIEFLIASGSLPPGVPADIFARLAAIAKKKKINLIADTSGEALQYAAEEGVYLLKPNLAELSSLAGKETINLELVDDVARSVILKGECKIVVVSLGPAGALLVTKDETHRVVPPPVQRKSTVGAGDSMVAGLVLALSQKKSPLEALQYGVACGTAATMNAGTELCRLQDVEKIVSLIQHSA
jgi:6-phosphofructokinase 2